ncbi:MAG TPA: alpha/beta hydrolase, partial [Pseudonocardia sp.]
MPTSQRSAGRRVRPEGVVLPGSGSDELFVRATFGATLGALGVTLCCPRPAPGAEVVPGYLAALDAASDRADRRGGALLIGGISLGAQVAVRWAARRAAEGRPGPAGLLLALPAWTGRPDGAPASVAASHSADALGRDGLAATLAEVRANTPAWLGDELARAWTRHGPLLADSLRATARSEGPTEAELAGLAVPV